MSYVGPDSQPPRPPRRFSGGPLTVTLAALVPTCLAGWLIYEATSGPGGSEPPRTLPSTSQSAQGSVSAVPSPSKPEKDDKGDEDDKGKGEEADAKPSTTKPPKSSSRPAASGPLKGKVVVVDPGHNLGNGKHTAEINRLVNVGTHRKECDTTGTSTNNGYSEAQFTLDVSRRLRTLLEKQGATVKFTQDGDPPWGPCVDERARIGNDAHADAVVSVHADGSAAGNRGFHVILPASVKSGDADTSKIVVPSRALGERIAGKFVSATGSAPSNYIGDGTGLDVRKDLGGLNLSTVPKVFIECGNMRDAKDEALVTSGAWRQKAAQGISDGIVSFLRG
ncbi:N-acetylmuramoyl-L-alanine amidase [Streptomyces durmitorensis]|uniref:N-acetylmuramoyl-L-alanine amidase n=1 Tax=Streptomyces durmitorensis TaxID=319947 RepID=A0ABY4Q175_9ACTN|nr:N-acetylmuramoyl-L-alanine amidase [Streptomyces durmitorensis]UQT58828.1 N-acetylmuramoyl-L-alanine amidase [Streptomyces durmitorensis]